VTVWSLVILSALAGGIAVAWAGNGMSSGLSEDQNPIAGLTFYTNPESGAAVASRHSAPGSAGYSAVTRLAAVPAAIWLTPEKFPTRLVGAYVSQVLAAARTIAQTPIFVVYGIPNRDCGNQSAGGLSPAEYPLWIQSIANALSTAPSIVILEPDSLALTEKCHNADERVAEISHDVSILGKTPAIIYLDAGHSAWMSPDEISVLLTRVGVSSVRGFATNVANYNTLAEEVAFGEAVSALTGGAYFVVDTGRNGNGAVSGTGETWCNPSGRKLGLEPAAQTSQGHHDANLWIKPPGESDGRCNGGPIAGAWWNTRALELLTNSRW
jgi:endoglucanase